MSNEIHVRSKHNHALKNIQNVIHTLYTAQPSDVNQPKREAEHSRVCNVTVKNEWNCNCVTPLPLISHCALSMDKIVFNFVYTNEQIKWIKLQNYLCIKQMKELLLSVWLQWFLLVAVKQPWAWLVLGQVTPWEYRMLLAYKTEGCTKDRKRSRWKVRRGVHPTHVITKQ